MHGDTSGSAGVMAGFAAFYLLFIVIGIASLIFFFWMYWRIFEKAGFSGALSFLNLIPGVGNLICLIILAFSEWPSQQNNRPMMQQQFMPPPPPPPTTPPQQYGGPPQPLQ